MNEKQMRKKAVALSYDEKEDHAPKVTASGKGIVAENILVKGKEHDVPIMEDASLVELLTKINIQEEIPEQLYQAVAEVFAFIYEADKLYEKNKH